MRGADLAVLVSYFVTMIAIGLAYSRQMKSLDMYFAGGRQLSWWLGGVSFLMAYVSALSIVVYAGFGYQYGLVALTIYWTTVPGALLVTWLFARRWRRAGVLTPVEFLETRFSPAVRQVFVWSGIPLKVIDEGLKIVAIGIFVSASMRISPWVAMIAVGVITLIYTMLGGLWAVVITDFVQFVLVTTGVLLLVPLTLNAVGGWRHFVAAVPGDFFRPVHPPYDWTYVGAFLVLSTLSVAGNWSLIQKFYSTRNDRECRGVGWLASLLFFLLPPAWIFTGMLARAFVHLKVADPQTVYAGVCSALLPPGMLGLIVAALFAATMSVLSSGFNVIAAVLTVDVHQRLVRPQASQKELVVVGRVLTAVVATLALAIALAVTHFHWTIFDTMVAAFGFFLPPTVLPVLGGLLSRRLSAAGAMAGFFAGIGIGLAFLLYKWTFKPANIGTFQAASIVVPAGMTALVLVVAAYAFPAKGEAAERASQFLGRLGRTALASASQASPAPVAGLVIAIMGLVLVVTGSGVAAVPANTLTLGIGTMLGLIGWVMMRSGGSRRRWWPIAATKEP
ncbi:MAG: sodium:solute symporter family transporter [Terriglobia bacterium]